MPDFRQRVARPPERRADPPGGRLAEPARVETVDRAFERFEQSCPAFATTAAIDVLRAREFRRVDDGHHVYLDYTGGSLYAESHVRRHMELLLHDVLGNPHSSSPASKRATELADHARAHVLRFFNAPPDEYALVFTANASHALKLIGEAYPFRSGGRFLLTFDNHNSVNGIREFARARGAHTTYVPVHPPDMRCPDDAVERALAHRRRTDAPHLFAYPAQSNFSGVQHPLEWIAAAHDRGWDVLLDAAAFVPTNRLDVDRWRPDYVAVSFYKMFGYPTGVGALIAKRDALAKLHRPWFAGGTITVASVQADQYILEPGAAAFEDGTLDYASLPAVDAGLGLIEETGLDVIHRRVQCLTGWLLEQLGAMRHGNGRPLVTIYGPHTVERRGGTVAINLLDRNGRFIDHDMFEARAADHGISLRTGCFCNPGAGELALGLTADELSECFRGREHHMTRDAFDRCTDGKSSGALRVSFGLASNFADVHAFVRFVEEFLD
jgi:selenocysteine lyase/cysteine desulfurase